MPYAPAERRTFVPRVPKWLMVVGIIVAIVYTTKELRDLYDSLIEDGMLNQSNPDPDDQNSVWDEIKKWIDWVKEELSKRPPS